MDFRNILVKVHLALLIYIVAELALATPVLASCAAFSLAQHKDRADIIALGTIQNNSSTYASLDVEKYFKGEGPELLRVTGQASKEVVTSNDFSFQKGKRYLLFLKNDPDGIFRTNLCMGTREITNNLTDKETLVLGNGYAPTTQGASETPKDVPIALIITLGIIGVIVFSAWRLKRSRT